MGDIMMRVGDILSNVGDAQYHGEYHDTRLGVHYHGGIQSFVV